MPLVPSSKSTASEDEDPAWEPAQSKKKSKKKNASKKKGRKPRKKDEALIDDEDDDQKSTGSTQTGETENYFTMQYEAPPMPALPIATATAVSTDKNRDDSVLLNLNEMRLATANQMKSQTESTSSSHVKSSSNDEMSAKKDENNDNDDESSCDDSNPNFSSLMDGLELTDEQRRLIQGRLTATQNEFKNKMESQRKLKILDIKNKVDVYLGESITDEEAVFIMDFCEHNHENLETRLDDEDGQFFLEFIRETMNEQAKQMEIDISRAQKESKKRRRRKKKRFNANNWDSGDDSESVSEWEMNSDDGAYDSDDDDSHDPGETSDEESSDTSAYKRDAALDAALGDKDWIIDAKRRKKKHALKKSKLGVKQGYNMDGSKRAGRLLLEDAMTNTTEEGQAHWSQARRKAFKEKDANPNAYYYRFLDPGVAPGRGKFTPAERELFMKRMKEFGVNMMWGEFSIGVPARVGYQCSNFYRELIKSGAVRDPNYTKDETGKLHFKRGLTRYKKKHDRAHRLRSFAYTVYKDPTGVFTNLPARHPTLAPADFEASEDATVSVETPKDVLNDGKHGKGKGKAKAKKKKGSPAKRQSRKRKSPGKDLDASDNPSQQSSSSSVTSNEDTKEDNPSDSTTAAAAAAVVHPPPRKRRRVVRGKSKKKKGKKKKQKKKDDDEYVPKSALVVSKSPEDGPVNPLKDLLDPITQKPMQTPAISPHGHVMEYENWCKILRKNGQTKNTCPFTKKRVTRRSLVKLTTDNFDQYRDKIINLSEEELARL